VAKRVAEIETEVELEVTAKLSLRDPAEYI